MKPFRGFLPVCLFLTLVLLSLPLLSSPVAAAAATPEAITAQPAKTNPSFNLPHIAVHSSSAVLPVVLRPQETWQWCWAASAQMIMSYLGKDVSQCSEANNRSGRTDCCTITLCPSPDNGHACAFPGWPEFEKYGFTYKTSGALSFEQLRHQIDSGRPVAFSWGWDGGGGHMMVANGYKTFGPFAWVSVVDPWAPCHGDVYYVTYDAYVSGPGYTHWTDYYDITRKMLTLVRPKLIPHNLREPLLHEPLQVVRSIVAEENFRHLGFESRQEADEAALGTPFQEFFVRLDDLKKYRGGPDALLRDTGRRITPLLVKGQVRSGVSGIRSGNTVNTSAIGGPNFIKTLTRTRDLAVRGNGLSEADHFLVKIPALQMAFLGHRAHGNLILTPLFDDRRHGFKAGVGMTADQVFRLLAPSAQRHNGLPG